MKTYRKQEDSSREYEKIEGNEQAVGWESMVFIGISLFSNGYTHDKCSLEIKIDSGLQPCAYSKNN